MNDCIFCKIIKGEIPCHKVYEDDNFLAFLDISPLTQGHTLLIPKTHYRWVYDVPNFGEYWSVAQKISQTLINSELKPEFVSFLTMGNDVPHAHIHIIPRSISDSIQPSFLSMPHLNQTQEQLLETKNIIINSSK